MRESLGATKPKGGVKAKAGPVVCPGGIPLHGSGRTTGPSGRLHAEVRRS